MAITRIDYVILLLCVAAAACYCCEAKPFIPKRNSNPMAGLGHGNNLGTFSKAHPDERIFNVLEFGAKAGGKRDNNMEFQKTWAAACKWNGKARMLIPQGVFLIGPVRFMGACSGPGPIIVQVVGTLKAATDPSLYDTPEWVAFEDLDGVVVTGGGTFDGQGAALWKYNCGNKDEGCVRLPESIKLNNVSNAIIRGITSINPQGFHIFITNSQHIRAYNLHLLAPADSPNTDGVHTSKSSFIKIARSVIATGDDCVSIGQSTTDMSVKKVLCGPGHGLSVGSLGKYEAEGDVRGIIIKNCTLISTDNGLRIKTYAGSAPSSASNIFFQDIIMNRVKNPIIIDQEYQSENKGPSKVKLSDIHYINIKGTVTSKVAVELTCSKSCPCTNVQLNNVNLQFVGNKQAKLPFSSACTNAKVGYVGFQSPAPCR